MSAISRMAITCCWHRSYPGDKVNFLGNLECGIRIRKRFTFLGTLFEPPSDVGGVTKMAYNLFTDFFEMKADDLAN